MEIDKKYKYVLNVNSSKLYVVNTFPKKHTPLNIYKLNYD